MRSDRGTLKYGGILFLLFFLSNSGIQDVTCEWMSFRGCLEFTSNGSSVKTLSNNGPSACLNACPENTSVLALQGHTCECLAEVPKTRTSNLKCIVCADGELGPCNVTDTTHWYFYEKVNNSELHLTQQNSTKCLAVIDSQPVTYEALDCNTSLPTLCYRMISQSCQRTSYEPTVWSRTEHVCQAQHGTKSFLIDLKFIDKCSVDGPLQTGSTRTKYWTRLAFFPPNDDNTSVNSTTAMHLSATTLLSTPGAVESSIEIHLTVSFSASSFYTVDLSESPMSSLLTAPTATIVQHTSTRMPNIMPSSTAFLQSVSTFLEPSESPMSSLLTVPTPTIVQHTSTRMPAIMPGPTTTLQSVSTFLEPSYSSTSYRTKIEASKTSLSTSSRSLDTETSVKLMPTKTLSTMISSVSTSSSSSDINTVTTSDKLILEYSLVSISALVVIIISIGACCLIRMHRVLKKALSNLPKEHQPTYREQRGRPTDIMDSGYEDNFQMNEMYSRTGESETRTGELDSGTLEPEYGTGEPEYGTRGREYGTQEQQYRRCEPKHKNLEPEYRARRSENRTPEPIHKAGQPEYGTRQSNYWSYETNHEFRTRQPDFSPQNRFQENVRPSHLHNGLTSTGRETEVLF